MAKVYFVENAQTREILNQKGDWADSLTSYRLAQFDTEDAAKAAFPAGVDCVVRFLPKKESAPAPSSPSTKKSVTAKFALRQGTKFLSVNDEFKVKTTSDKETATFDSEDAALDKAEALGIDLDRIKVIDISPLTPATE